MAVCAISPRSFDRHERLRARHTRRDMCGSVEEFSMDSMRERDIQTPQTMERRLAAANLAPRTGLEPAAFRLGGGPSIQLRYRGMYKYAIYATKRNPCAASLREERRRRDYTLQSVSIIRISGRVVKPVRPYTPRYNGEVERSCWENQKCFCSCHSLYALDDFAKQLAVRNRRSNNFPMRPLGWFSSNEFAVHLFGNLQSVLIPLATMAMWSAVTGRTRNAFAPATAFTHSTTSQSSLLSAIAAPITSP